MKNSIRIAAVAVCLVLLCLAAGCASKDGGFTLEDLERANTLDAVFREYASVRSETTYYGFELPDGGTGDITMTSVCVRGDGGNAAYFDTGDWGLTTVENGNVYWLNADGSYDICGFFDDGYYEAAYLPYLEWSAYMPSEDEEIVSVSVGKGVRKVITNIPMSSDFADYTAMGYTDGTVECRYELDAKSGRILRVEECILTAGGESVKMAETAVYYGEDDDFTPPGYVALCKDMTETRTVRCVMSPGTPEEKTFTFTLPKKANLLPLTMEPYDFFTDAECTVPYETPMGGYPDEHTIYLRKAESQ